MSSVFICTTLPMSSPTKCPCGQPCHAARSRQAQNTKVCHMYTRFYSTCSHLSGQTDSFCRPIRSYSATAESTRCEWWCLWVDLPESSAASWSVPQFDVSHGLRNLTAWSSGLYGGSRNQWEASNGFAMIFGVVLFSVGCLAGVAPLMLWTPLILRRYLTIVCFWLWCCPARSFWLQHQLVASRCYTFAP